MAPQELQFPRVPAAAGTPWPEQTAVADFTTLDYEGRNNGSGTNERMSWVQDPLGSSAVVWRVEVKQGDVADQFGDAPGRNRAEIWRDPHSSSGARVGDRVFYAWSVLMRSADFKVPTGCWGLSWQVHTPSPSATPSPLLALDYDAGPPRFRGVGNIPGGFNFDKRQFFVVEVMHHTSAGEFRAWCSVDNPPDLTKPPTLQRVGYQTHPGDGDGVQWPKLGLYRAEGAASTYPWVAHYYGYGLALTAARAVELARFGSVAPPPPPQPDPVVAALEREWKVFLEPTYVNTAGNTKKTIAQIWREANPGEWTSLRNYRDNDGSLPPLRTSLGRQMVEHVTAYKQAIAP